jgi:hypothetical protein
MTVSETKIINGSTWSQAVATATPALKHTFNTTQNWTVPNNISAAFFMIAGGGGGGSGAGPNQQGSGAGGGGVYPGWLALQPGSTVSITIGAGGTAGPASPDFSSGGTGGASYVTIGNFVAGGNGGSGGSMSNISGTAGGGNTFTSNASGLGFTSPAISNVNFIFGKDTAATNQNGSIANTNAYAGSGGGQFDTTNYMPHCHGGSGLTGGSGAGAGNITFGNVLSVIGYSGCGYGGPAGASTVVGPSGGGGGIVGAGSAATANVPGAGGAGGGAGGCATMRSNTAGAAGGAGAVLIFY